MSASKDPNDIYPGLGNVLLRDIHTIAVTPNEILSSEEQIEARQDFENETGVTKSLAARMLVLHMRAVQEFGAHV